MAKEETYWDNFGEKLILVIAGGLISLYLSIKYSSFDNIFDLFDSGPLIDIIGTSFLIIVLLAIILGGLKISLEILGNAIDFISTVLHQVFFTPIKELVVLILDFLLLIKFDFVKRIVVYIQNKVKNDKEIENKFLKRWYYPKRNIFNFIITSLLLYAVFHYKDAVTKAFGSNATVVFILILIAYLAYYLIFPSIKKKMNLPRLTVKKVTQSKKVAQTKQLKKKKIRSLIDDIDQNEKKFRIELLLKLLAVFTTFLAILTPILFKVAKPPYFIDLATKSLQSFLTGIFMVFYCLTVLYWAAIIFSFLLELYHYRNKKMTSFLKGVKDEAFNIVCQWPINSILNWTAIFTFIVGTLIILLVLSLLKPVLIFLSIIVLILLVIFRRKMISKIKDRLEKINFEGVKNEMSLREFISVLLIILLSLITPFVVLNGLSFITSGFDIDFDSEFYYINDSINMIVTPYGLNSVNLTKIEYLDESLPIRKGTGGKSPIYATINSSQLKNGEFPKYVNIEYEFQGFLLSRIQMKRVFLPYFNLTRNN